MTDDATLLVQLAEELEEFPPVLLHLSIAPQNALQLVGLLQLAMRHPGISPEIAAAGREAIDALREFFEGCPAILEVIKRGDDPNHDWPHQSPPTDLSE